MRVDAPPAANDLERYLRANPGHLINKYLHYFPIYDRHFAGFRGRPVTVVEFGVFHGGSLEMWRHYFGPAARVVGVDINPACMAVAGPQIEIVTGDQDDREFLRSLGARLGGVDVAVDDGGHRMTQQIATFEEMWPFVRDGGVYLVEDLHTSYWPDYGGGYRRPGTFIEYAKDLIDAQHAWHSRDAALTVGGYTRSVRGMHVYDSVICFEKGTVTEAAEVVSGKPALLARDVYGIP